MRRLLLKTTIAISMMIGITTQAQIPDLVFDNTFNSGTPHIDEFPNGMPNQSAGTSYGRMKQIADNIYVYFVNYTDWSTGYVNSRVFIKKINGDGSVSEEMFFDSPEYFAGNDPQYFAITDVVYNEGTDEFFVLKNNYSGTERFIQIYAYDFDAINYTTSFNTDWGTNGINNIYASSTMLYGAKGALFANQLIVAYNYSGGSFPIQIAATGFNVSGISGGISVITNNPSNMASNVADFIMVNQNDAYIADNAAIFNNSNNTYNDAARVLHVNPTGWILDNNYDGEVQWSTQTNTPFQQDVINKMYLDGNKILVAGYTRDYDGSMQDLSKGRISRFMASGDLDNTFSGNGTFEDDFSNDYFNWQFNDIVFDGVEYYLSAKARKQNNGGPGAFIIKINGIGEWQNTATGANDYFYKTNNLVEIKNLAIVPGSSENKFVFTGSISHDNPPYSYSESVFGRLVWATHGGSTGIDDVTQNFLSIYPNPANTVLNIELNENTHIEIINLLGKTVSTQKLNAGINSIDVSGLTSGVYFIQTERGVIEKFVKD